MAQAILPAALKPGDRVGIVASSAPEPFTDPAWFERGLTALKAQGYEVVVAETTTQEFGYRVAPEQQILSDFHGFVTDPTIKGIIFAGGGKNSNRLLGGLDTGLLAQHPKVIVGVSDPTVLLNAITARTGLITFHGPSVVWDWGSEALNELTARHFVQIAGGDVTAGLLEGASLTVLRSGKAEGHLVAGCLSAVRNLLGTPHEPEWDGAVFAWEDVSKPIELLDATLTHFRDQGVLDKISGMVVGELVNCEDSRGWNVEAMLHDLCDGYSFPILTGLPFGHTSTKYTLPIGARVQLDTNNSAPLQIIGPWVS
ncbi:S66 peptidase family protein [Nocardia sp. alder85J]|uniref:S66 peptidase family protein n=1 Tax=Nocardia sp. alder85J TaxID=2862949 RepID=UPI001CD4D1FC|nr:LD-carboxypeptidase [Nocardia sp. alder85J]MCX4098044.1 LD-carboxypeptidase [Nocardia sp. alder85J]